MEKKTWYLISKRRSICIDRSQKNMLKPKSCYRQKKIASKVRSLRVARSSLDLDGLTVDSKDCGCALLRGPRDRHLDQSRAYAEGSSLADQQAGKCEVAQCYATRLAAGHGLDVLLRNPMYRVKQLLSSEHARLNRDTLAAACILDKRRHSEEAGDVNIGAINCKVCSRETQAGHDRCLNLHAQRDDSVWLANNVQLPLWPHGRLHV